MTPRELIATWRESADDCDLLHLKPQAILLRRVADELAASLGVDGEGRTIVPPTQRNGFAR